MHDRLDFYTRVRMRKNAWSGGWEKLYFEIPFAPGPCTLLDSHCNSITRRVSTTSHSLNRYH